jgi:hypothetical protein
MLRIRFLTEISKSKGQAKMQEIKGGTVLENGQVKCSKCKNVAKNDRGHNLHWTLKHGKGRVVKKAYKKELGHIEKTGGALDTPQNKITMDVEGKLGGNPFMITVELAIAATAIRPL